MKRHRIPNHLGASYVKDYNRGWKAWPDAQRRGLESSAEWQSGGSSAFVDGYLDYNADREKWHLAYCTEHHNDEGGCGVA